MLIIKVLVQVNLTGQNVNLLKVHDHRVYLLPFLGWEHSVHNHSLFSTQQLQRNVT